MYSEKQYETEKLMMSKQERYNQERFEKIIDILILYKQANPTKDVYLNEETVNKVIGWFQNNMSSILENIN